jgi:vesicle-fusing ATPase
MALTLRVAACPGQEQAKTNRVFLHPHDLAQLRQATFVTLGTEWVYPTAADAAVERGTVGLNAVQRRELQLALGDAVPVRTYTLTKDTHHAVSATFEIDTVVKRRSLAAPELSTDELEALARKRLVPFVISVGQSVVLDYYGTLLLLVAARLDGMAAAPDGGRPTPVSPLLAMLGAETSFLFVRARDANVRIRGSENRPRELFRADFNFERMGIGGLDKEFSDIFRRAFASRVFPPAVIQKLGIGHVRGMLLHGPPGTGKTLIARQIGKMLNGKEPKVVNGPEILNKYVGQSEENIRNLFKEAEADYLAHGDQSDLHILIFDEIDAICKQRGSQRDGTGVHDTVVNQLLSKIDGVNALNNILIIGMTNRKDLIDEALLRPGRLEVHIEIGLPDDQGRLQILRIHTAKMRANKMLLDDVSLEELAAKTRNYSGAELEGLCRSAAAYALYRHIDLNQITKPVDPDAVYVGMDDFRRALEEVRPAFGVSMDELQRCLVGGFIDYGARLERLLQSGRLFRDQVRQAERSPLMTLLIEGAPGTGKTALAAKLAIESDFPFIRLIAPEQFVGFSEPAKVAAIARTFEDAYRSSLSIIVLDNIERLVEYAPIGPRFSNLVVQSLLVLVKRVPPANRRLFVVATTSNSEVLDVLELRSAFQASLQTSWLLPEEVASVVRGSGFAFASEKERNKAIEALSGKRLGVKKTLMLLEMARETTLTGKDTGESEENLVRLDRLLQVLADVT